jgi:recombinational DNA repair ATPase RecF
MGRPRKRFCKRGHELRLTAIYDKLGYRHGCSACVKIYNENRAIAREIAKTEETLELAQRDLALIEAKPVAERQFYDWNAIYWLSKEIERLMEDIEGLQRGYE